MFPPSAHDIARLALGCPGWKLRSRDGLRHDGDLHLHLKAAGGKGRPQFWGRILYPVRLGIASLFVGLLLAAGCTSATEGTLPPPSSLAGAPTQVPHAVGTVSGVLYLAGMEELPAPGVVTLEGNTTYSVEVGADGRYSAAVRPGTYVVWGRSPKYSDGGGRCTAMTPSTVEANATLNVDVFCTEK